MHSLPRTICSFRLVVVTIGIMGLAPVQADSIFTEKMERQASFDASGHSVNPLSTFVGPGRPSKNPGQEHLSLDGFRVDESHAITLNKKFTISVSPTGPPGTSVAVHLTLTFDWDSSDPPNQGFTTASLAFVQSFDPNIPPDSNAWSITGYALADLPSFTLSDSITIADLGTFTPTAVNTVAINDLGVATGVPLMADLINPNASGFVSVATFRVPNASIAMVPEPSSSVLLAIGTLAMMSYRLHRRRPATPRLAAASCRSGHGI